MEIRASGFEGDNALLWFYHDVGIPFYELLTPDISYTFMAEVNKDSSVTVVGEFDGAPSHEMYIYIPNSDIYAPLLQFTSQSFFSLLPPMEHDFSISL
jgi:hypothetical protein